MWQNVGKAVGNAIQKVKKIQLEIESQLDAAVGAEANQLLSANDESVAIIDSHSFQHTTASGDRSVIDSQIFATEQISTNSLNSESISKDCSKTVDSDELKQLQSIDLSGVHHENIVESHETTKLRYEDGNNLESQEPMELNNESSLDQISAGFELQKSDGMKALTTTTNSSASRAKKNRRKLSAAAKPTDAFEDNTDPPISIPQCDPDFQVKAEAAASASLGQLTPTPSSEPEETTANISVPTPSSSVTLTLISNDTTQLSGKINHDHDLRIAALTEDYESKLKNLEAIHSNQQTFLQSELQKLREVISDRERALETAMTKMYESHQQLEEAQSTVVALKRDVTDKANRIEQLQKVAAEGDLKAKLKTLQELIVEKDDKLTAFQQEGQTLAKKQGELEKLLKQGKKELKEKSLEIAKLKESKDQLIKAIEEAQEVIRKHEADLNNATKSMSAMTAVNQASNEKMLKLEGDISAKMEELSSQRRALETAWSEHNEMKRQLVEVKGERDELKRMLGEGNSKFLETETSRRDVEQREAVLKATSKQLQDSLQRQMNEFASREERLREEANEMRKRWQEAISSRENLATELAASTAPLLRQISTLQDSIRTKSDAWQLVESSLSEKAFKAERAAEQAEKMKLSLEDKINQLNQQLESTIIRANEFKEKASDLETQLNIVQKNLTTATDQVRELQSQLYFETGQKQALQSSLHELEIRKSLEIQQLKDSMDEALDKAQQKISQLQIEKDSFFEELRAERDKVITRGLNGAVFKLNSSRTETDKRGAQETTDIKSSFAASEKGHQRKLQQDDASRTLQVKISQVEASRDALLEEVSFLSSANTQLEEKIASMMQLTENAKMLEKKNDALLILLGEKEEELQAAIADNKEVKSMYQFHLHELMSKIAPEM